MRIIQAVADISKTSGGPSYTVNRLAQGLAELDATTSLVTLESHGEIVEPRVPFKTFSISGSRRLMRSKPLKKHLLGVLTEDDILHNHGLWRMPNLYAGHVKQSTNCKLVMSPRGMLSEWALTQSKWQKRVFAALGQKKSLALADVVHATAESEFEDIRKYGIRAPVAIIPNGIDIPELSRRQNEGSKKVLFLSRIHPKKGVDQLLNTWSEIACDHPGWELMVCGPGEEQHLKPIKSAVATTPNATYLPPVYGEEKNKVFASADVFVLPTKSENFGIVVAEALANQTPAIVYKGAPWEGLNSNGCGWWIDDDAKVLRKTLEKAIALSDTERARMGQKGRQWMLDEFSWNGVSTQMLDVYKWLTGAASKPDCVISD